MRALPARFRTRLDHAIRLRVDDALDPLRRRVRDYGRRLEHLERLQDERRAVLREMTTLQSHFERLQFQVASVEERLEESVAQTVP